MLDAPSPSLTPVQVQVNGGGWDASTVITLVVSALEALITGASAVFAWKST